MKYFTFVASILTLFFVCQETFAQVQPDNTSKSLDINQVNQRFDKLEKELDAKKKDFWDVFDILASLLIPASITFFGFYYPHFSLKMRSLKLKSLPHLGLNLVFAPAVKEQSVV